MVGFNTNIDTMETAARHVDTVSGDINGLLSKVANSVNGLSGSVWTGASQARFTQIMTEWQQQSRKLNTALDGIEETLRSNRVSLDTADQDAAAAIGRVGTDGPLNI